MTDGISDIEEQAANGAVLFLTLLVKERSVADVPLVVKSLISKLQTLHQNRVKCRTGILALISIAATQKPQEVISELLRNEAIFFEKNSTMSEIWRKLGGQNITGETVWNILKQKIEQTETFSLADTFSNARRNSKVKIVDVRFLALISAGREVISQVESKVLISSLPDTIATLFSRWAMVLDATFPLTAVGSAQVFFILKMILICIKTS